MNGSKRLQASSAFFILLQELCIGVSNTYTAINTFCNFFPMWSLKINQDVILEVPIDATPYVLKEVLGHMQK